jgi:hypothetical protein
MTGRVCHQLHAENLVVGERKVTVTAVPPTYEAELEWALDEIETLVKASNKAKRERKLRTKRPDAPLTLDEAAAVIGVCSRTMRNHVKDGSIRPINMARKGSKRTRPRFDRADLDDFKAKRKQEAKPCEPPMSSAPTIRRSGTPSFGSEVIAIADRLRSGTSARQKR